MRISVRGALLGVVALACAACSGADNGHPQGGTDYMSPQQLRSDAAAPDDEGGEAPCTPFEKRDCSIDLGVVNGVHNCTKGVQICENGDWSDCALPQL